SLATLTRWPDGVTDPAPKLHEDGTVLTISGAGADWKLMPERVLHRGTIPDRTRFSRGVDRLVTRLVAGPMHETRLLSRIVDPEGIAGGWALHETVHFGREG
ncbi:MAG: hypothetical protein HKN29_03125, partial [Rhodothermales bacterium]|nr:hypothetical protein [Rhodothermales bacterium]